jgi:catechol 2,3-dioxygenase-like lactoylglutathione lyase family enzyme
LSRWRYRDLSALHCDDDKANQSSSHPQAGLGDNMAFEGLYYVRIQVSDLARTKRFYGETLGWKVGTDEPVVAGFWFGAGYLVAVQDERPASERRYAGGMHAEVRVDDLDAQHARLTERGVAVNPIQKQFWGERNFSFTDPDGYVWSYGQPIA